MNGFAHLIYKTRGALRVLGKSAQLAKNEKVYSGSKWSCLGKLLRVGEFDQGQV